MLYYVLTAKFSSTVIAIFFSCLDHEIASNYVKFNAKFGQAIENIVFDVDSYEIVIHSIARLKNSNRPLALRRPRFEPGCHNAADELSYSLVPTCLTCRVFGVIHAEFRATQSHLNVFRHGSNDEGTRNVDPVA